VLNASGVIDPTMYTSGGTTDHGTLTGLGDDDHTQYLLVSGTRAMTGDLDMAGNDITLDDNAKVILGTGGDAEIYYNGIDLVIDPDAVGAGAVAIGGNLTATDIEASGTVDATGGYKYGGTSGITASISFEDNAGQTHDVEVDGGIITQWNVT